jgi:hypothetical protein
MSGEVEATTPPGSVSKVVCTLSSRGKGEVRVDVYRHLAPITVSAILDDLPIQSRVNLQPAMVCMFTTIKVGVEKARTSFVKGEVAFVPSGSLLCFFTKNVKSDRGLNPVGKIEGGLEFLEEMRRGDVLVLSATQAAEVQT